MSMTTGNENEIKVEEDVAVTQSEMSKQARSTVEPVKKEAPKPVEKVAPKEAPAPAKQPNPTHAAIVFIAQRSLDQPGFEDFKALYPHLFE